MASTGGNAVAEPEGSSTAKDEAAEDLDSEDEQDKAVEKANGEEEEAKAIEKDEEAKAIEEDEEAKAIEKDEEAKANEEDEEAKETNWPDLGSSITQRCRKRLEWAQKGCNKTESRIWVCESVGCATKLCKLYHELLESREELEKRREDLEKSREELEKSRDELPADTYPYQKIFDLQKKQVDDGEDKVDLRKARVEDCCELILKEHEIHKDTLIYGKAAGNHTDYKTQQTNRTEVEEGVAEADAEAAQAEADDSDGGQNTQQPKSPSKLHECFNRRCEEYVVDCREYEKNKELDAFWLFCDAMFLESKPVPHGYDSKEFGDCIEETCQHIVKWKMNTALDEERTYYRPKGVAQETKAVQPILFALMWKISRILGGSMHLTKEQYLPKDSEKSKRWIDAMFSIVVKQHLGSTNGSLLGKSVEIKPLSRKGEGQDFTKMVKGGENQVIGHAYQTLWDAAFQYCRGLGKDGRASGMVLTMASALLLDVTISGVGTQNATLKSRKSRIEPLFSKKTSEVLFDEKKLEKSGLTFAPNKGKEQAMQQGFKNLVYFVMDPGKREEIVNASSANIMKKNGTIKNVTIKIEKFLGSGAYCSVHRACVGDDDTTKVIVKIAKDETASVRVLKRELQVLKELKHSAIPKLYTESLVKLVVHQRCERNRIESLVLDADEGQTAGEACKAEGFPKHIECVFEATKEALAYAHCNGWAHLDVQPSNIITKDNGEGGITVLLNDWGSAAKMAKTLYFYRGSPPFSDDALLRTDPKKKFNITTPKPGFDMFSLTMTICYLLNRGLPWDGFNRPLVTVSMLAKREAKALKLIENSQLNSVLKEALKKPLEASRSPATVPVTRIEKLKDPNSVEFSSSRKRRRKEPGRLTPSW